MQYTKYANRETANTPVFGVSVVDIITISFSLYLSRNVTYTHDKCSLVVNNHTVASQIIFTDS